MVPRNVFFFQAEDGIRDIGVTGVQTCALPIWSCRTGRCARTQGGAAPRRQTSRCRRPAQRPGSTGPWGRSEERRVGKECRSRWLLYHQKNNTLPPSRSIPSLSHLHYYHSFFFL